MRRLQPSTALAFRMSAERNKQLVAQFFEHLGAGDINGFVAMYADDGAVWTCGNTLISGTAPKAQIAQTAGAIFDAFPNGLQFTILGMVAEGDKVAVEAESRGMHVSGELYNNLYHFLFEFRDGKVLKLKEYMDTELVTDILCGGQRPPRGDHPVKS